MKPIKLKPIILLGKPINPSNETHRSVAKKWLWHLENSPQVRSKSTKHTAMQPSTFKMRLAWQAVEPVKTWDFTHEKQGDLNHP